jgi:multidrug efflux system membrane fusion protein
MSGQGTQKNWFEAAFDQAKGAARPALAQMGAYAQRVTRWSAARVPGGSRVFWAAIGLVLLALLIWAIRPGEQAPRMGRGGFGGPMPVGAVKAATGDIHVTLNALGTVTPLATVTVRPQISGQILKMDFEEGQMVKAGDVLAEIDPRPYKAAYDQALGQLERDRATLANAKLDLKRQQDLFAKQATSQQALATQEALVRSSAATVKSDRAAVEAAAINLGYTKIRAPVDGRAGLRQVDVGNLVQAGQTNGVVVITQLEPISVMFALPEDDIGRVMARLRAGATLSVAAFDRGQTAKLADGTLATVDNVIDPSTGTVKMRALFDNRDGALFPQQFVNVRLLIDTMKNQVWTPASAIERGAGGTYVYVVQPDSTVAMRAVTVGPQDGERVAILKGLNPGERVVTDGADRLSDGLEVTIASGPNASSAKPPAGAAAASPDPRAQRRAAVNKACAADIRKFCPGAEGFERFQCLRGHRDELGESCKNAMSQRRRSEGRRGGGLFGGRGR